MSQKCNLPGNWHVSDVASRQHSTACLQTGKATDLLLVKCSAQSASSNQQAALNAAHARWTADSSSLHVLPVQRSARALASGERSACGSCCLANDLLAWLPKNSHRPPRLGPVLTIQLLLLAGKGEAASQGGTCL